MVSYKMPQRIHCLNVGTAQPRNKYTQCFLVNKLLYLLLYPRCHHATLGDRHHRKLLTFTTGESICRAERGWSGVVQREERREAVVAAVLIFAQMREDVPHVIIVGSPFLSEAIYRPNVAIRALGLANF